MRRAAVILLCLLCLPRAADAWSVRVWNGIASPREAASGDIVSIRSGAPAGGMRFVEWRSLEGDVEFEDARSKQTTFVMPPRDVLVAAKYEDWDDSGWLKAGGCTAGTGAIAAAAAALVRRSRTGS